MRLAAESNAQCCGKNSDVIAQQDIFPIRWFDLSSPFREGKQKRDVRRVCMCCGFIGPEKDGQRKKAKPSRPDIYPWIAASFPFFLLRAFFSPWLAGLQTVGDATASATQNSNQEWKMDRFVSARKLTMQAMKQDSSKARTRWGQKRQQSENDATLG